MRTAALAGLIVVCAARVAFAEEAEANVGAVANATSEPQPAQSSAAAAVAAGPAVGRFAAPNGQLGAGLTDSAAQKLRVFGELDFAHMGTTVGGAGGAVDIAMTGVDLVIGGGYKLTPNLELVAAVPIGYGHYGMTSQLTGGGSVSDSGVVLGNLHLEASYFQFSGALRWKVGGALEYGPWTHNLSAGPGSALIAGWGGDGGQNWGFWAPDTFSVVAPVRFEYGTSWVVTGDAGLGLHIATGNNDTEFSIQLTPGFGYYLSDTALIGIRAPFLIVPTQSGANTTYLALEPYARLDFGKVFLNARFTFNVDEPLGTTFSDGSYWGLHLGGGATF